MNIRTITLISVVVSIAAMSAVAQPPRMMGQKSLERVEQYRKVRLIEMLELNEDQSARFLARLKEHDNAKRAIMKEKMDVLDKIDRLVRNNGDEKDMEAMFAEVGALDNRIADHDRRFFRGLNDILTVEQRAKYLLFERHFEKELREAMREVQRRRFRGDGDTR